MISTTNSSSALVIPTSRTRNGNAATNPSNLIEAGTTPSQNQNLGSRLIPKIGAIVKRFSLNYSGEGLVTDPGRVRTVRVGIRFQVQVDSFLNNSTENQRGIGGNNQHQPPAITRSNSAPNSIQYSPDHHPSERRENNNRQFIIQRSPGSSPTLQRRSLSSLKDAQSEDLDSSSGVSSLGGSNPQSPVSTRRHSSATTSLAFHNRINQALTLCRNQLAAARGDPQEFAGRRSGVQVYRRRNNSPEGSPLSNSPGSEMEDVSSYQILRCFPGSNVNSAREFNLETAAFEKDVRERVQWIGAKLSSIRVPQFVNGFIEDMKSYAAQNPVTAVLLLAVLIASALPVTIFLGFAIASILISFIGFLIVEGALLTVGSAIFGIVLVIVGLVTLGLTLAGSVGFLTTSQIYGFFTGRDLKELLPRIPIIGAYFVSPVEKISEIAGSSTTSSPLKGSPNGKMSNGHPSPLAYSTLDDEAHEGEVEEVESSVEEEEEIAETVNEHEPKVEVEEIIEDEVNNEEQVIVPEEEPAEAEAEPPKQNGSYQEEIENLKFSLETEEEVPEVPKWKPQIPEFPEIPQMNGQNGHHAFD